MASHRTVCSISARRTENAAGPGKFHQQGARRHRKGLRRAQQRAVGSQIGKAAQIVSSSKNQEVTMSHCSCLVRLVLMAAVAGALSPAQAQDLNIATWNIQTLTTGKKVFPNQ